MVTQAYSSSRIVVYNVVAALSVLFPPSTSTKRTFDNLIDPLSAAPPLPMTFGQPLLRSHTTPLPPAQLSVSALPFLPPPSRFSPEPAVSA
jgi:hypothetical protein